MNVTVENLAPCKKLLRVEVEAQAVDAAFNNVTQEFQRQVRLPGFRPGKAPRNMVLKKFEKDILAEVKKRLIPDSYRKATKEQNVNPVTYPDIEEVQFDKGQSLIFTATVETAPEFELPEYKGVEAKKSNATVTDEDVEKALNILRERMAKYESVDRELTDGDIAVVDYAGSIDGKPLTEVAPDAKGIAAQEGFWINIANDSFLPGFSEQLKGAKAGEKRTVNVTFPNDFGNTELAGKSAVYEVDVKEVKQRDLPELDQAFAESYGAESMDKLREGVRNDLENELTSKKSRETRNQLVRAVLDKTTFELPEGIVASETRNVVYEIVQENQNRGISKDVIEQQKDEIYNAATVGAKQRVKASFVFSRIAEKESIKVEKDEFNARIQYLAAVYKTPVEKLVKDLEKRNAFGQIHEQLLNEKVIKFIEDNARITEVDPKELEVAVPVPAQG